MLSRRKSATISKKNSEKALSKNKLLQEAWIKYYQHNPDYEKSVSICCDVLENLLGQTYWPQDEKPQLGKFVNQFKDTPSILSYAGNTIVNPKNLLTDLLLEFPNIRGQHTEGKGRKPTPEEAKFVLHITITVWNLQK